MPFRFFAGFACVLLLLAACQEAPPTLVVLVVTATPEDGEATQESTVSIQAASIEPTRVPPTDTPAPTPTADPFPTPVVGQMQVAEQPFERGRMFWIQPRRQIWVLVATESGRGTWSIFPDTFEEGEPEMDPSIIPPGEGLYQPRRGFGKLWRENEEVREALGWAITPDEFGYISRYEYHPGGTVNEQGGYEAGPGYHILFSLYEEAFRFNEGTMTWRLGRGEG